MRKIINKRVYDTDTAKLLGSERWDTTGGIKSVAVYKKHNNEYFWVIDDDEIVVDDEKGRNKIDTLTGLQGIDAYSYWMWLVREHPNLYDF